MESRKKYALVVGAFRPDLEAALWERVRVGPGRSAHEPVMVLTGSQVLPLYLRRKLAASGPLWDVQFYTFAEMAQKLGGPKLAAAGKTRLPDWAEPLLVQGVIESQAAGYFEPVADLPGFVQVAAGCLRDLKEAGLRPEDLPDSGDAKLAAFRSIYEAYERRLDELGLYDAADLRRAAAEAAPDAAFLRRARLVAYGFYDLNGLQRRLLLALAAQAKSAAALVPADDAPAFEYARPLVRWLEAQGFERHQAGGHHPVLRRLFTPPSGEAVAAPETQVLSVPGEPREVREIVRRIIELAEAGVAFDDIGVLMRSPGAYARPLREALSRCGIPCFVAGGLPLAETRVARSVLMLADLLAGDLPRAEVMEFIHFAPLNFETLTGGTPNTSDWDLLSIHAGIVAGPEEWPSRLDRLAEQADGDAGPLPMHELAGFRAFIGALLDARETLAGARGWGAVAAALSEIFRRFIRPDAEPEACEKVLAALKAMLNLPQVEQFGVAATVTSVREALKTRLAKESLPGPRFQSGAVYVGDIERSRGLGFRAVIVPGLVEKSFPAASRQDPIVLDRERRDLARRSRADVFLPPKSGRISEERMLFALALDAGAESRTLTYSRLDVASGRDRVPSHFVPRLAEAMTGQSCDLSRPPDGFRRVPMFPEPGAFGSPVDADEYDLHAVAGQLKAGTPQNALYLATLSEPFARGVRAETARWQKRRFTEYDGQIGEAAAHSIAGVAMSPTRIEEYAGCPFAYFLRRVLQVEPLEEPEALERITALDRGSLIHNILQHGYRACYADGAGGSPEALAEALHAAAEAEFRRRGPVGPTLTWAIDCAEIRADLARFAALDAAECQAAGARPAMFETRFGMAYRSPHEDPASTDRPLALEIDGKTFLFKGRIDRIDHIGTDAARVIDYKTGQKSGKADAFQAGRSLQLPLYLLAAEMLLPDRTMTEAAYAFATRRGKFSTVSFSRAALRERIGELECILRTVEDCIERGLFINIPDKARCRYCDLKDACGANCDALFERKKGDPEAADLLALEEIE